MGEPENPQKRRRLGWYAGAAILALIAGVALSGKRLAIEYRLWRYRSDPDSFKAYAHHLCRYGKDARDRVISSFEKHGDRDDVAAFRVAVFHTLRCLRYEEAAQVAGTPRFDKVSYVDLPVDVKALDTMVAAYVRELSEKRRSLMLAHGRELDFNTWFELYARLLASKHGLPERYPAPPSIHPYSSTQPHSPARHVAWCSTVKPAIEQHLLAETTVGIKAKIGEGRWRWQMVMVSDILKSGCKEEDPVSEAVLHYAAVINDLIRRDFKPGACDVGLEYPSLSYLLLLIRQAQPDGFEAYWKRFAALDLAPWSAMLMYHQLRHIESPSATTLAIVDTFIHDLPLNCFIGKTEELDRAEEFRSQLRRSLPWPTTPENGEAGGGSVNSKLSVP